MLCRLGKGMDGTQIARILSEIRTYKVAVQRTLRKSYGLVLTVSV